MVAHQVAGKTARDAFFLDAYPASRLPLVVVAAALTSFALALVFSRMTERQGPARIIPAAFALSSGLHLIEYIWQPTSPGPAAVMIYLHIVGLGALLMSGFWLLLSEVFDLRQAKAQFGRIAGAGTAGGIAGGIIAERIASLLSVPALLLLLALLHLICCLVAASLHPPPRLARKPAPQVSAAQAFRRTPLLWQLATLVFLGTCTAAMLDYLFKLGASLSIGKGPALVRYFAFYYTGSQALTFLVQTFVARTAVERMGVARTVASLPVSVGLASTVALLVPVYPAVAVARGLELILRGSLFRSGYEFLYTPVPQMDKRAAKTIIDVACDRLGDAVGAGAVQVMIFLGPALARSEVLGLAMVVCSASAYLALQLDRSYRRVLERSLTERMHEEPEELDLGLTLLNTAFDGVPVVSRPIPKVAPVSAPMTVAAPPVAVDSSTLRFSDLRSHDARRVCERLAADDPFDPLVIPQVIRLLAWNQVSAHARRYLERRASSIAGQLNDALLDQDLDFGVRRRIPRILAAAPSPISVAGLIQALADARFDVRQQAARALEYLKQRHTALEINPQPIYAAAERELDVTKAVWQSRRLLDQREGLDSYEYLDPILLGNANLSLEHVFSLLAVIFDREPLLAAFRSLHHDDPMYRGLGLEYLETVLPERLRTKLFSVLEASPPPRRGDGNQPVRDATSELLATDALRADDLKAHAAMLAAQRSGQGEPGHGEAHV